MSGYYAPSGATATGSLNSTTITIAGGDVAPILPGMMIYFGSRTVADGPGYLIAAVVRTDASNGTITLSSGLASAQSSQPFLVDLSQAGNASTYASFSLSRVINALGEFLGLGTTVDATTKQIVLNKATSGAISRILWEIAGADQFRLDQRSIGGAENFAIQSTNDGGVNWIDALLVRRSDARCTINGLNALGLSQTGQDGANIAARVPGSALSQRSCIAMFSTFQSGVDTLPRRSADIVSGFRTGIWGNEFLSICVGNNGSPNDVAAQTLERLTVTGQGSVGIGTTSPGRRLHVAGTGQNGGAARFESTDGLNGIIIAGVDGSGTHDTTFVELVDGGGQSIIGRTGQALGSGRLRFAHGGATRLQIAANGPVAVGSHVPISLLDVGASDGANEGGEIRLRGAPASTVDWIIDVFESSLRIFTNEKGSVAGFASRLSINTSGHLLPGSDNSQNLGSASFRMATVFAGTGSINTSDARQKVKRGGFTDAELDAWAHVQPLIFRWKDSVERKGDAARQHAGYIAQEIAAAFEAHGLNAADYGLWCEDAVTKTVKRVVTKSVQKMRKVTAEVVEVEIRDGKPVQVCRKVESEEPETAMLEVRDEAGAVVRNEAGEPLMHPVPVMEDREVEETEEVPDGTRLGLRYDQCAVFEAAWARREIERLRARIAALEA